MAGASSAMSTNHHHHHHRHRGVHGPKSRKTVQHRGVVLRRMTNATSGGVRRVKSAVRVMSEARREVKVVPEITVGANHDDDERRRIRLMHEEEEEEDEDAEYWDLWDEDTLFYGYVCAWRISIQRPCRAHSPDSRGHAQDFEVRARGPHAEAAPH